MYPNIRRDQNKCKFKDLFDNRIALDDPDFVILILEMRIKDQQNEKDQSDSHLKDDDLVFDFLLSHIVLFTEFH